MLSRFTIKSDTLLRVIHRHWRLAARPGAIIRHQSCLAERRRPSTIGLLGDRQSWKPPLQAHLPVAGETDRPFTCLKRLK